MVKKRWLVLIVMILSLLWGIQIIRVNKENNVAETCYQMQEPFEWKGMTVTPTEAHIYTLQEYNKIMGAEAQTQGNDDCIVCLKVNVVNNTGKDMGWDVIMDDFGYGFETLTWCSAYDPFLGADINIFHSEVLEAGENQDIWYATSVEKDCFKQKHWELVQSLDFYYVMSVYPEPVKIKLECNE